MNLYFSRQLKLKPWRLSAPKGNDVWRIQTKTNWQLLLLVV
jgi:hypothetical protein